MAADEKKPDPVATIANPAPPAAATGSPIAPTAPAASDDDEIIDFNPEDVDRVLSEEDPQFAAQLKDLEKAEFKTDVAIEAVDIEVFLKEGEAIKVKQQSIKKLPLKERLKIGYETGHARISKFIDDFQNGSIAIAKGSVHFAVLTFKKVFKYTFGVIGKAFSWIFKLPKRTKLLSVAVLVLAAASGASVYMSLKGHFLPQVGTNYLTGFAEVADASFDYKEGDSKESFDSEIRHPEHMYELEKVVVNLKPSKQADHLPMGLFEFYIEMNSQEATVEVGDRKTQVRHTIERVLEQLSYEELITPQGKSKLKFIVRKELNDMLTKSHHVRQIYIKSFVLKP